jgi:hypothetical protein
MKRILPNAALFLVSFIVCTLAAELLLWFIAPGFRLERMFYTCDNEKMQCHEYMPSALFGYELIPKAMNEINSFGMRDKEYPFIKPDGTFRILLLGDSITEFGKWSKYVEDRLNVRGRYEIMNCAVAGWNLPNYRAYLKYKGMSFKPDLVLIGFCLNDMTGYNVNMTLLCDNKTGWGTYVIIDDNKYDTKLFLHMNTFLFRHSVIYRMIMTRIIYNMKEKNAVPDGPDGNITALAEMKTECGGRMLGIIYPYLKPLAEYDSEEMRQYSQMKAFLDKVNIEYLDLTPYFNKYGAGIVKFRTVPEDKIHYNPEANQIKAGIIYDWLTRKMKNFKSNIKDKRSTTENSGSNPAFVVNSNECERSFHSSR